MIYNRSWKFTFLYHKLCSSVQPWRGRETRAPLWIMLKLKQMLRYFSTSIWFGVTHSTSVLLSLFLSVFSSSSSILSVRRPPRLTHLTYWLKSQIVMIFLATKHVYFIFTPVHTGFIWSWREEVGNRWGEVYWYLVPQEHSSASAKWVYFFQ